MSNEEHEFEVEAVDEIDEIVESKGDDGNDNTDWKALALDRQEKAKALADKMKGIGQRYKTKFDKIKDGKTDQKPAPKVEQKPKSNELDYGMKAFLVSSGIKTPEEMALVQKIMTDTGKNIEGVIGSKYFTAELEEMRQAKATTDAIPTGTKRSQQTSKNDVEYWLAQGPGKLPPPEQRELREKVVNARIAQAKSGNNFASQSVVTI